DSQRKACDAVSFSPSKVQLWPTTCPALLIPNALLLLSPDTVPRSINWPLLQKKAWNSVSPSVVPPPITSPRSLSQFAPENEPPREPRSINFPCCQRNG